MANLCCRSNHVAMAIHAPSCGERLILNLLSGDLQLFPKQFSRRCMVNGDVRLGTTELETQQHVRAMGMRLDGGRQMSLATKCMPRPYLGWYLITGPRIMEDRDKVNLLTSSPTIG
jgi:hypothetical protein